MCNENKREIHPFHHLKGRYEEQVKPHAKLLFDMTSKPQIILLIYVWLERSGIRKEEHKNRKNAWIHKSAKRVFTYQTNLKNEWIIFCLQ